MREPGIVASGVPVLIVSTWIIVSVAILLGWTLGGLSAWSTARLRGADPVPTRPLAPDFLTQLGAAAVVAALAMRLAGDTRWLLAALLAAPLVQVAVTDLRERYVYLVVAGAGVALGVALAPLVHASAWWSGLAGAAGGGLAMGAAYLLGRLLYRGAEPLARGDVWIGAMAGAAAGPRWLQALAAGVLFSGGMAVIVLLVHRSGRATMPYGPGLCLGGLAVLLTLS